MGFENPGLPAENELPLKVRGSEEEVKGAESTVWKTIVADPEKQERLIALKQIRREQFANDEEMKKSKAFYDFLKSDPDFGRFVPDTLYFKARLTPNDQPHSFTLQRFIEGRSVNAVKDEELYKDPETARQLLDLVRASIKILRRARRDKTYKPDFGTGENAGKLAFFLGNRLNDPRHSTNIQIAEKPDENGQRVFFVDTGVNINERTSKISEMTYRELAGRAQEFNLRRWAKRLEQFLASYGDERESVRQNIVS